jgi:hypothetical protein
VAVEDVRDHLPIAVDPLPDDDIAVAAIAIAGQ